MQQKQLSPELEKVRASAMRAISPVKPAASKHFLFNAKRTNAGRHLPPYYLVYFLLVDLLGFKHLGQGEKVSWSVPIDFQGQAFVIEHRKMEIGVFAQDPERKEEAAREIVIRIHKAVKAAQPFFDWLADMAVARSAVNVVNNSSELYQRYTFLLDTYRTKADEADRLKNERVVEEGKTPGGGTWHSVSYPAFRLLEQADWLALSAVEAFFAWTEHVLIHLAIFTGRIHTAGEVAAVAEADWSAKFKSAFDLTDAKSKALFDRLLAMRKELRNYVAHGAFGKQGEAFSFHSGAGAVPVLLPHRAGTRKFKIGHGLRFNAGAALDVLEEFRTHLWDGPRSPAEIYIQQSNLPVILTMAADGTYANAMRSPDEMKLFVDHMTASFDRAVDMDW